MVGPMLSVVPSTLATMSAVADVRGEEAGSCAKRGGPLIANPTTAVTVAITANIKIFFVEAPNRLPRRPGR